MKTRATLWTQEKRSAARTNIAAYVWAREQADAVCQLADEYAMQAERIYELIVAEGLPRYYHTGHTLDPKIFYCRYCGVNICEKYAKHYPWIVRPLEDPWKIQCPDCLRRFPSNDFGGFYRLGLDAHGVFQHELARQKNEKSKAAGGPDYLINELYPEMGEGWGVDDGFGYYTGHVYDNGVRERHNYIATYLDRGLWGGGYDGGVILLAINTLAKAYVYTGEARYGRAGAMLLDRVADFYPGYDWYQWAEFRGAENFRGKICDSIWECFVTQQLASAYDAFYPVYEDAILIDCLREKSLRYGQENPKNSASAIRAHAEHNILREIYSGCRTGRICGNFGMEQAALAKAAVVLDAMPETGEWLDWIMRPGPPRNNGDPAQDTPISGGNVLGVLTGSVDRDGMGDEASPEYNALWLNHMVDLAEVLHEYDACPVVDLYENPKFAQMFTAHIPLMMAEYYTAQIGDSGRTASKGFVFRMDKALSGYRHLGGVRLAQYIHCMNGNSAENLHGVITDRDPEALRRSIENAIREHGPLSADSDMMTGYGFAVLRDGEKTAHTNTLRDFSLYFGLGDGHGHADALNLGIDAYGLNFAPDLGYPEVTGTQPNRLQWVSGTLSHNTVMVDGRMQHQLTAAAAPLHYDDAGRVKLMDMEAGSAYPQTRAYRRSIVMVDAGDGVSYGVDFFRILGGDDHLYSFHAQSNTIHETRGLTLIPQTDESGQFVGSYAGPEVPWGQDPNTVETSWEVDMLRHPPGMTWLYNVRRDRAPELRFTVDFQITDFRRVLPEEKNLHLRMTMLGDFAPDEVAIARAKPPHYNTPDIPYLEYVLTRRTGNNLDSLFTTVFEPYCDTPYITDSLTAVPVAVLSGEPGREDAVKALKIPLKNGRIDYVVYATNREITYRVDNLFDFRGFAAVCSLREGKMDFLYGNDCELLCDMRHPGALTGVVADFTRELTLENSITVALEQQIELEALTGRYVYIDNDGAQNAVYRIHRAHSQGVQTILDIGQVSPIRALGEGTAYKYNIDVGQKLRIPLSFLQT
ncbi:heparinase II/III domain-containing protein [Paenibacillus eucommiae]|uniref:Heparinase II/III-like C-terminal domain-containing protein n=1 Tax=Paenibacillus eucommiae TaxID=1355755 RepID=A0ABS4IZZ6_9BACL|nr:heparinase II/III family protein [Paenibacillus eucommiae]MBP1993162.1 hypothetical protein [Paenibacillus eucommiae]